MDVVEWSRVFTYNIKVVGSITHIAFEILFLNICALGNMVIGPMRRGNGSFVG